MDRLPELDLSAALAPYRRSRYAPLGPGPSAPLPPLPHLSGPSGLAGIPRLSSRRASAEDTQMPSMYTDPFAPRPHIPGQVSLIFAYLPTLRYCHIYPSRKVQDLKLIFLFCLFSLLLSSL